MKLDYPFKPLIAIAPMMGYTDKHCRYFLRLFSKQLWLYSEMVIADAILHGKQQRLLAFNPQEQPVVLQLGGNEPNKLQQCAKIAELYGYNEINLNVGCPSDRVQAGRFGACLMQEPALVADCVAAMQQAVSIPVTVKTRIGVDNRDSYEHLTHFIATVAAAGCKAFIIHARKAWLKGLSPKENREIPPLNYTWVYQLKRNFPNLQFILNGGVKTVAQIQAHLAHVDGVMVGREAYHNPYFLAEIDQIFYSALHPISTRQQIIENYLPYLASQLAKGVPFSLLVKPLIGLFQGMPGARSWRRHLSSSAKTDTNGVEIIQQALKLTEQDNA